MNIWNDIESLPEAPDPKGIFITYGPKVLGLVKNMYGIPTVMFLQEYRTNERRLVDGEWVYIKKSVYHTNNAGSFQNTDSIIGWRPIDSWMYGLNFHINGKPGKEPSVP